METIELTMQPQHKNYTRQAFKFFTKFKKQTKRGVCADDRIIGDIEYIEKTFNKTEKFMLPEGGFSIWDKELKAIDPQMGLKLPFEKIAIEYDAILENENGEPSHRKTVIFAYQGFDLDQFGGTNVISPEAVMIFPIRHIPELNAWVPIGPFGINISKDTPLDKNGCPTLKVVSYCGLGLKNITEETISHYAYVVANLLNALACSNVKTVVSKAKKNGGSKKAKSFDDYHILELDMCDYQTGHTVGGAGCCKREHVRRGHVRRYKSGHTVWVNSSIVNAGRGLNKSSKTYALSNHN